MTILAWHFLADSGLLRDGRKPPPNGKWLTHRGRVKMCDAGLHASIKAIDALKYAPGSLLCRVECGGTVQHDTDKLVCTRRRILWRADASDTLRAFARWCASGVLHHWDAPEVVRDYLATGDESKRAAAWAAARDAAWDAAMAALSTKLEEMLMALEPR